MKRAYRISFDLPSSAARTLPFVLFGLALLALAGCAPVVVGTAGAIVLTRPSDGPPADTEHSIQPHESWCYETMGDPVCYAHAQDVEPDRLINVDPPNRYPLTPQAYSNELHPPPPPVAPAPVPVAVPATAVDATVPPAMAPAAPTTMPLPIAEPPVTTH